VKHAARRKILRIFLHVSGAGSPRWRHDPRLGLESSPVSASTSHFYVFLTGARILLNGRRV